MTQTRPLNAPGTTPSISARIAEKSATYRAAIEEEQHPEPVPTSSHALDAAILEARAAGNWPLAVSLKTRRDELTKQ